MRQCWIFLPFVAVLAACADPLAGIERVSEMENPPADSATNALPTPEELNREAPIFAGLFRGDGKADLASEADEKPAGAGGSQARRVISNGPEAPDVAFGTVLPFGQIARVCEAKGRSLGKVVEQAARRGARYKLYDSAPNTAAPRTFYVKGFKDNCPRQFTAALALFGTPQMHEQLRYGLPASEYPYSTTDKAYETVKSQICGVARTKPCGSRISRLEQTTVFVSVYENFSENARWADILIHSGDLIAVALKTP